MMRLDKYLASCGFGSRKEVKAIIRQGRVFVNQTLQKDDDFKISPEQDVIMVDDVILTYQPFIYIMLHKPSGVVSATMDHFQTTVIDLMPEFKHRSLFPLGRLDIDTEGLLIISDDGKLAHRLLTPKSHVEKEYYVELNRPVPQRLVQQFLKGVTLEDGYECKPALLKNIDNNKAHVIIQEGKFHQIKRMFQIFDLEVVYLKRIRFHTILLDDNLALGDYRMLTSDEISRLMHHE